MIRYIEHDAIDFEKWDECINKSINGIFYAYSWYLDICTETWDALVEDDYKSVMPLPVKKRFGVKYAYQPFFIQQLGVFSTHSLTEETTVVFLNAVPKTLRYAYFNMNTYNRLPSEHHYIVGKGITHELDLIPGYGHLYKNYSTNQKRNIKKAKKSGLYITSHTHPEEIISVFKDHHEKYRVAYTDNDYKLLKHLIYSGIHKGMVVLKAAYSVKNTFCAGIVFFISHQKAVWLFSGATPEARQNGAMSMLVDDFIQENAGKELVLDFEGSANPNLARFYRAFGSEECVFLQIRINNMPLIFKKLADRVLKLNSFINS